MQAVAWKALEQVTQRWFIFEQFLQVFSRRKKLALQERAKEALAQVAQLESAVTSKQLWHYELVK